MYGGTSDMMTRFFFFMIGFGSAVAGGVTMLMFLNIIPAGYGFRGYLLFITTRVEFYMFVIGMIFVWGSLHLPFRRKKNIKRN